MNEVLGWLIPAVVVFGSAALLLTGGLVALRYVQRSPKARAGAEAERVAAGSALLQLDDAVGELDLEAELSGALYDGTAPAALRRARMTAAHVRDDAFAAFAELGPAALPTEVRRVSSRIRRRVGEAEEVVRRARQEHGAWMSANVSAGDQAKALRRRIEEVRAELGDPKALVQTLRDRFDEAEFADITAAVPTAEAALREAESLVSDAAERTGDPTRTALPLLAEAERALRRARDAVHTIEEGERLLLDAAASAPKEWAAARAALREANALRAGLDDAKDAEKLGLGLREIEASLSAQEPSLVKRPISALREVAATRDRLDLAVGDARTAQQRLRNARTALTGAVAVARAGVAHAEPMTSAGPANARLRLAEAQRELATAVSTTDDPVVALDAARRAARHAEDAVALANYARLTSGPRPATRPEE